MVGPHFSILQRKLFRVVYVQKFGEPILLTLSFGVVRLHFFSVPRVLSVSGLGSVHALEEVCDLICVCLQSGAAIVMRNPLGPLTLLVSEG